MLVHGLQDDLLIPETEENMTDEELEVYGVLYSGVGVSK